MRLLNNIIRVIQWIPVIWRDADWDYEGLLDIIEYKVRRMRQLHLTKSHGTDWSKRVLEMDKLRHLIALVHDDPDDEWTHYYNTHSTDDLNDLPKEKRLALDLSHKREERNWHSLWKYLDNNLRHWWD